MESIIATIIKGLAIGLLISAPMGPIGALCIRRTLNGGRWSGFFTGVGASLSDIIYCLLTGLGMSIIIDFITTNQNIIQILGSLVLMVFALYLVRRIPRRRLQRAIVEKKKNTYTQDFITGFFLTFSNPLIMFLIIGLFARFNFLQTDMNVYISIVGFVSIVVGALVWWFLITSFVNVVRGHFTMRSMIVLNRIIGFIILIMALVGLVWGIRDYFFSV